MTDYLDQTNQPDAGISIAYGQTKEQADEQMQGWQRREGRQEGAREIDSSSRFKVKHPFIK